MNRLAEQLAANDLSEFGLHSNSNDNNSATTGPSFQLAAGSNPAAFAHQFIDAKSEKDSLIKIAHGTTTLAF
ncbi:hypothetical protein GGI24_002792, partial [Coemansia furcata]